MGLLGTLIGGGLGFMMGGPLGAIIGGAIGSNFGAGIDLGERPGHPGARRPGSRRAGAFSGAPGYSPLQAQQTFLVALISLAAKVAKADGRVTPAEVRSFDSFLQVNLRMSADERKVAARIFNEARDSDIPASEFARQIRQLLGSQPARLRDLISLLLQIAMADGHLDKTEEDLIRSIAWDMGLSDRDYDEARSMFKPTGNLDAAYEVLGVLPEAPTSEVKSAYRKMAKEYHPDVLARKGMGEDFESFAKDKMRAVNDAYDQIKEARGI